MKKKLLLVIALIFVLSVSVMVACGAKEYKVTFDAKGGSAVSAQTVGDGKKIETEPVTTKDGYAFGGWFEKEDLSGDKVTFPYTVTKDITLYAKWTESITQPVAFEGAVSYSYLIGAYEWGPAIDKMIIYFEGAEIPATAISKDIFDVSGMSAGFPPYFPGEAFTRTITDAYLCDKNGNKVSAQTGRYAALDFLLKYEGYGLLENGSPFSYNFLTGKNSWLDLGNYANLTIKTGKTFTIDGENYTSLETEYAGKIIPAIKDFVKDTYSGSGKTLQRAAFETDAMKNDGVKNALIIWLHGAGEGGTDVDVALLGNDVVELSENTVQKYFKKSGGEQGAYVLAVQTPTMWMDNGNGQNHNGGDISIYTDVLWKAIKDYVSKNGDIDANRIYIGGCSNGGYMTMNMLFEGGTDYFAAAYPVCQAFLDTAIDATKLNTIKNFPIWFTQAANDGTVAPANYTIATYVRLINAGATNVHLSYFADVRGRDSADTSYDGHWSWIYTLQDRCVKDQDASTIKSAADVKIPSATDVKINGQNVTLWGWLAAQVKA